MASDKKDDRGHPHIIAVLLAVMAVCALAAGIAVWLLARGGFVILVGPIAEVLPADRHVPFLADLWAHATSYLVGVVGGIVVIVLVWRSRGRAATARRPDRLPSVIRNLSFAIVMI